MTAVHPDASRQAVVEAALVLLERMGLSPADLAAVPQPRKPVPTFAEYVPVVSAAVSAGTRRAYGSYWNRVLDHWGTRRLDEPTPSEMPCCHKGDLRDASLPRRVVPFLPACQGLGRGSRIPGQGRRFPSSDPGRRP